MTPTTKRRRAAGYLRVSKAREGMEAPAIYREQIEAWAKATPGIRLGEIYQDIDLSGRRGAKVRPAFERMLTAARAGEFDLIIVPKLSRFGRSVPHVTTVLEELEELGVAVRFLDLDVDTSTPMGRFMRTLRAALAEFESDLISSRWKDTLAHVAHQGRPIGRPPYGYRREGKTFAIVEPEAEVVREAFRRYDAGEPIARIGDDLTRRGWVGKNAGSAPGSATKRVADLLANPAYVGELTFNGGPPIEASWPPLIDRELFHRVQERREAMAGSPTPRRPASTLSGLLVCAFCGGPMWRRGPRFACARWLRDHDACQANTAAERRLEREAAEAFLSRLAGAHRRHVRRGRRLVLEAQARTDPANEIRRRLTGVEAGMERLAVAIAEGPGPGMDAALRARAAQLEAERERLTAELAREATRNRDERSDAERARQLVALAADLPRVWEAATSEERHDLLATAVDRLTVAGGGIREIVWRTWVG